MRAVNGVITYRDGRQVCDDSAAGKREYKRRFGVMVERQMNRCAICLNVVGELFFDHADGRGSGGGHRCDAIWTADGKPKNAALCFGCNSEKGSKHYEWVDGAYVPKQCETNQEAA